MTIFSPELNAQFSVFPREHAEEPKQGIEVKEENRADEKVIKVDFSKKKQ